MTGIDLHIPQLETERLILRVPRLSDFEAFAAFCASPRSVNVGGPYTRDQAFSRLSAIIGHWQLRGYGRWLIAGKADDAPLGVGGLYFPEGWPEPEIAWSVFDHAEGRGIALEAALATRSYAYDILGWSTLISCTLPDNTRSVALARRMGAVQEDDFHHETYGPLNVWRHLSPDQIENGGMEGYA